MLAGCTMSAFAEQHKNIFRMNKWEGQCALSKYGCDVAQGYLYSPHLPARDFEAFVAHRALRNLA